LVYRFQAKLVLPFRTHITFTRTPPRQSYQPKARQAAR
jgi:hypothetical protein